MLNKMYLTVTQLRRCSMKKRVEDSKIHQIITQEQISYIHSAMLRDAHLKQINSLLVKKRIYQK